MFPRAINAVLLAAVLSGLGVCTIPAQAQQFSADIVRTNAGGEPSAEPGKLYVSEGKVRIEMPDTPDGFFVVDTNIPVSYFVRSAQRVYMDSRQSSQLTQILVPVDVTAPCRQWRRMADIAMANGATGVWTCKRIGQGSVGGRDTIEYLASLPKNRQINAWLDPRLKWPVKVKMADGMVVSLENIREQPQSADLFKIPPGYRKFDPQALIDQIKQSDAWVEPQQ